MSQAAQEMQRLADELRKNLAKDQKRSRGSRMSDELTEMKEADVAVEAVAKRVRKKKANGVAKATRQKKVKAGGESSLLAGIRSNPKGKVMFLNTAEALSVTKKGLKAILSDLSGDERVAADRLLARIAARGE